MMPTSSSILSPPPPPPPQSELNRGTSIGSSHTNSSRTVDGSQALPLPLPMASSSSDMEQRTPLSRRSSRRNLVPSRSVRSIDSSHNGDSIVSNGSRYSRRREEGPENGEERQQPTSEELKRAAETILAAKKYGTIETMLSTDELQELELELNDSVDANGHSTRYEGDYNNYGNSNNSNRSVRSSDAGVISDGGYEDVPQQQHGVLNRGGAFAVTMPSHLNSSRRRQGSGRSLTSMSSMEDNYSRGGTSSRLHLESSPMTTATESISSARSMQSRESSSRHLSHDTMEQRFMDRLRRSHMDFAEILLVLREAIEFPLVIKEGLEELASLQLNAEDHDILCDLSGPHIVVDSMLAHRNILEVQMWGCGAIWNMTGTVRNQLAFVDAGALDVVLDAMEYFLEDVELQEKGLACFSNLGAAEENIEILLDQGAVARIVEAMNKHSDIGSVQVKGCIAITNLASHDTSIKQQIMDLGGGGAVVISMVMHSDDDYIQETALRALRNLCANSEENKIELANIGAIDAVIAAMQVHRDEGGVQEEGAWTLSNLAANDDNKAVIGDCGGIDVIIRAMWVHSDNVGIQEWCSRALFTLTLDPHNGDVVLEVGGISALVNAMQAHSDSPAVQEMGCATLGNLCNSDNTKMRIVDEEALDAIVMAMVLYSDDAQVQERACMVLLRLAIPDNFKAMHAANSTDLVRVAAEKFPGKCGEAAGRLLDLFEESEAH